MSETEKVVAAILAAMLVLVIKEDARTPAEVVKKYRACCDSLEDTQKEVEKV